MQNSECRMQNAELKDSLAFSILHSEFCILNSSNHPPQNPARFNPRMTCRFFRITFHTSPPPGVIPSREDGRGIPCRSTRIAPSEGDPSTSLGMTPLCNRGQMLDLRPRRRPASEIKRSDLLRAAPSLQKLHASRTNAELMDGLAFSILHSAF